MPTELRLILSDPQGGFVRYHREPSRETTANLLWLRDMKEAPRDGYVREISMQSGEIRSLLADAYEQTFIYFYFKAFGKYGKGRIAPRQVREATDLWRNRTDNLGLR